MKYVPDDRVSVPKPSMALEKGLLFLLLLVGVVMLTLVVLPARCLVTACGVAAITAARNCSASRLEGT